MEVEKIVIVESQKKLKICVHVPESYILYFVLCCCIVSAGCVDLQSNLCVWRFHLLLSRSDL